MEKEMSNKIIIALATALLAGFGGTAIAGGDSSKATEDSEKLTRIAEKVNEIDKNTAITKFQVESLEKNLNTDMKSMKDRIRELEKARRPKVEG